MGHPGMGASPAVTLAKRLPRKMEKETLPATSLREGHY